jgi:DDE superfamily endonuclease/Tc5 transposase-like protein
LGPIVEKNLFLAPNIIVKCSKSGKLTRNLVEQFLEEAVQPKAKGDILYIIDKWSGHADEAMYESRFMNDNTNMKVMLIPENCTDLVQPLDTYFHRQLKFLVRQFYEFAMLHENDHHESVLTSRNGILKLQSLVHFLLSAPAFKNMIRQCWFSSELLNNKPEFENIKTVCFSLGDMKCSKENCNNNAFIKCSWCKESFCFENFFHEYHIIDCTKSGHFFV